MHTDPGPYWDWRHYFTLLGRPFERTAHVRGDSGVVTIRPDYASNRPTYTGCVTAGEPCAAHGSSEVRLYSQPDTDVGARQGHRDCIPRAASRRSASTTSGARVSTGQQYAVAERSGDWTAIWYLGQKAWFQNPAANPTAVRAVGAVVTPKDGLTEIPVYGQGVPGGLGLSGGRARPGGLAAAVQAARGPEVRGRGEGAG